MSRFLIAYLFTLATLSVCEHVRAENPVFQSLVRRGVAVSRTEVVRLPAPTVADGMSAAEQRRAIEAIAQNGHSWDDLTRPTVVAPFVLKITRDEERPEAIGRRLDLWFVAYANLNTLASEEFLNRQFKSATSESDPDHLASMRPLTAAQLMSRGIAPPRQAGDPGYTATQFSLLDRVRLTVTTRGVRTETPESVLSASILDPRFANDAEFPNQWRPISRDEEGRRHLAAPQPYSGYGGYAKVTRLIDPGGALFVEYHVAFAEPQGWFGGTNLLRSKLPIVAQFVVRGLRRGLKKSD